MYLGAWNLGANTCDIKANPKSAFPGMLANLARWKTASMFCFTMLANMACLSQGRNVSSLVLILCQIPTHISDPDGYPLI